jgi:GNAT superfamily N-acetyltransferase
VGTVEELQGVLERAPDYFIRVSGETVKAKGAEMFFDEELPKKMKPEDNENVGIYLDEMMIGCIDILKGFPDEKAAFIGLLLLDEEHQHGGYGSKAYMKLEEYIKSWGTCNRILLGVLQSNDIVIPFWKKMGYVETGKRFPYKDGDFESEIIQFEKKL